MTKRRQFGTDNRQKRAVTSLEEECIFNLLETFLKHLYSVKYTEEQACSPAILQGPFHVYQVHEKKMRVAIEDPSNEILLWKAGSFPNILFHISFVSLAEWCEHSTEHHPLLPAATGLMNWKCWVLVQERIVSHVGSHGRDPRLLSVSARVTADCKKLIPCAKNDESDKTWNLS